MFFSAEYTFYDLFEMFIRFGHVTKIQSSFTILIRIL